MSSGTASLQMNYVANSWLADAVFCFDSRQKAMRVWAASAVAALLRGRPNMALNPDARPAGFGTSERNSTAVPSAKRVGAGRRLALR